MSNRFSDAFLEELKARVRPSDLIGKSVKLKRQGREYAGLSPFTTEKSPSFFVNDEKGFYHCFSSGKHGDVLDFLQETERLTFIEAVERLAAEAGMEVPAADPRAAEREERRKGLAEWMDLAQRWFTANLARSVGAETRAYLDRRGLPMEQWNRFGLGYAPDDREALKTALVQRGARVTDLVEMGLLIQPEGGGQPYDRFRGRLMFPIQDAKGRTVSFGGRAMKAEERAKYLNGPETSIFHKGATLYGLFEARKILAAAGTGDLVVVEGYMDVIACQRAGIPAVAPMGTALTEEQIALLWRSCQEPVLCFDGDKAGRRAAFRAVERALPLLEAGKSFRFAMLEGGADPDDILRTSGDDALRAAVAKTQPFVDMLFRKELDVEPYDTPERRAALTGRLRAAAEQIKSREVSRLYADELMARLRRISPGLGPRQKKGPAGPTSQGVESARRLAASIDPIAAALALAALRRPDLLQNRLELVAEHGFGDEKLKGLAQIMVSAAISGGASIQLGGTKLVQLEAAAAMSGLDLSEPDAWDRGIDAMAEAAWAQRAMNEGVGADMARLKADRDAARARLRSGSWA